MNTFLDVEMTLGAVEFLRNADYSFDNFML